jgi:hypothetical protein
VSEEIRIYCIGVVVEGGNSVVDKLLLKGSDVTSITGKRN